MFAIADAPAPAAGSVSEQAAAGHDRLIVFSFEAASSTQAMSLCGGTMTQAGFHQLFPAHLDGAWGRLVAL
jgi:hypothetical protein